MELDHEIKFDPARPDEFFDGLPSRPAVVLIEPHPGLAGARPVLLRTADLKRRMRLLLGAPEANSKRLNLREYAAGIRFRITGSAFEQALLHWQQARALWPEGYRKRLRLHPAAFVKLSLANAYPRAYVTRRLGAAGLYVGPFATRRAASSFLEPSLDLFRIRRCQIKIRPDPKFPGCVYSEMKMCLAPCFGGCTSAEYRDEVGRTAAFLRTSGTSLADALAQEREAASAQLDFEHASALHRRLEKVQEVRRGLPELVRPIDELHAVIVARAEAENAIALYILRGGEISEPFVLQFDELASQPRSVEQILRELMEPAATESTDEASPKRPAGASATAYLEDHLALLARWFYSRPREGEIFFREPRPVGWPYRRILRACRRLLAPQGSEKHD
jgi:excinuclease UvrABC nuclease subunit